MSDGLVCLGCGTRRGYGVDYKLTPGPLRTQLPGCETRLGRSSDAWSDNGAFVYFTDLPTGRQALTGAKGGKKLSLHLKLYEPL